MDPEDLLPADILLPLIKAQNVYGPFVNAAWLSFGLLAHWVKRGSRLPIASPMPGNSSSRAGVVSPYSLWDGCFWLADGHLLRFYLGEQGFLISLRTLWRRPLFLSAGGTTDEVKGLMKENPALCSFMRDFLMGFYLSCIVLHVAVSC